MIKGVNKLIVEVSNPDSEFFERAIFFVKPQMKDIPNKQLNKCADALILEQAGLKKTKKRFKPRLGFLIAGAAGAGAAAASIFIKLFR